MSEINKKYLDIDGFTKLVELIQSDDNVISDSVDSIEEEISLIDNRVYEDNNLINYTFDRTVKAINGTNPDELVTKMYVDNILNAFMIKKNGSAH